MESGENGAQSASNGVSYRTVRELGKRSLRSFAAVREPHELVVAQRFVRPRGGSAPPEGATTLDAEALALLLRDARCLAKSWHLNIGRVRHADLSPAGELTIASELIDGATLGDLVLAAAPDRTSPRDPQLPIPVLVRILLDVLAGLSALHGLRDGMNVPIGAIHGELCPANVVVGRDGVARIVNALRPRPVRLAAGSEATGYAAPETSDGTDDPRSDIYAVGVMLWEGLVGRRLFDETEPSRVLSGQRENELVAPHLHPSSPFARLADTAMRALSFDASLRFRSAAEMAHDLRKIAGTRLAAGSTVAACVSDLAGERVRTRRAELDPASSGTRRRASEREMVAAPAVRPSTRLRASPRKPAPTVEAFVPDSLLAASRPNAPEGPPEIENANAAIPAHAPAITAAPHSPLTPNLVLPSRTPIPAPLAPAPSSASSLPATETPRDFVIPIDVTETLNEAAPRQRRSLAKVGLVAAALLVAMGGFIASRQGASFWPKARTIAASPFELGPAPAVPATPPPAADDLDDTTAIATTPAARAKATASPSAARPAPPSVATAPPPASAAPAKPKKSIYDPDGL